MVIDFFVKISQVFAFYLYRGTGNNFRFSKIYIYKSFTCLGVVYILRNKFLEHFYPPPPPPLSVLHIAISYCVKITLA